MVLNLKSIGGLLEKDLTFNLKKGTIFMARSNKSGWTGWITFAVALTMLNAVLTGVAGLVAVFNPSWVVASSQGVAFLDIAGWGWWNIVLGVVLFLTALSLNEGKTWGRLVVAVVAMLNAVSAMLSIGAYPFWSVIFLVIDICIFYAITVHGDEMS